MTELKAGYKVYYNPKKENGIIKSINGDTAFVVYRCGGDWGNYTKYTGCSTRLTDLEYGWVDDKGNLLKQFCDHYYIHTNAKWQPVNQMICQYCGDEIN